MKDNKKTIQILMILTILFTIMGGSLAYWNWSSSEGQKTSVVFTSTKDFSCSADGGGNITAEGVQIVPTTCTDSEYATANPGALPRVIKRKITVRPTLNKDNMQLYMKLWLTINNLGSGLRNSDNFRYVLTTSEDSCSEGTIKAEGNFKGLYVGDTVTLLDNQVYDSTTVEEYYLYIWLDEAESSHDTMNQPFNFSLGGECSDNEIITPLIGDAYALYTEENNTLTFVRSETSYNVGDTYNDVEITNVYTDFENSTIVPWSELSYISNVIFEDEIKPISTAKWFQNVGGDDASCYIDLSNLNTSRVNDMSYMFASAGSYSSCELVLEGIESLDTSNVINMYSMFNDTGTNSNEHYLFSLDLSNWDVSNVTNMSNMFSTFRENRDSEIIGLENWDVSSVVDMSGMFSYVYNSLDLGGWDVSNVINYQGFSESSVVQPVWKNVQFGIYSSTDNSLRLYSIMGSTDLPTLMGTYNGKVVSAVYNISESGLSGCSSISPTSIIAENDILVPSYMSAWFSGCTKVNNIDLSKFDTSNVTYMYETFKNVGSDTSVTSMTIKGLKNWNTENVYGMYQTFYNFGLNANYTLDLSNWNVSQVIRHDNFDYGVENKILDPLWK